MQRYECKYLVPEGAARRILAAARPFVKPDANAEKRPGHVYPICSLYLDAQAFPFYRETVEGKFARFKLRVRSYSDAAASKVVLEIKRRQSNVVQKVRAPIPREFLPLVLQGENPVIPGLSEASSAALAEFKQHVEVTSAVPRLLVRYDRQAYVGATDDEIRVTFDRRLRTLRWERPEVRVDATGFREVPAGGVVLELKFNDRAPFWMLDLVKRFELKRISFSKYCRSVDRAFAGLGTMTS